MSTPSPDNLRNFQNAIPVAFKFKYKEAAPTPPGIPDAEWNKLFSAADSRIYNRSQKDSVKSKQARATGATRVEALEALAQKRRHDPTYYPDPTSPPIALPAKIPASSVTTTTITPPSVISSAQIEPKKRQRKNKISAPVTVGTSPTPSGPASTSPDPAPAAEEGIDTIPVQNDAKSGDQATASPDGSAAIANEGAGQVNASNAKPRTKSSHRKRPKNKKTVRNAIAVMDSKAGVDTSGANISAMDAGPVSAGLSLSAVESFRQSRKRSPPPDTINTKANYENYGESPRSPKTPDSESGYLPHLPPSPTTPTSRTYEPSIGDDGVQPAQDSDDNASFEGSDDGGTYCICRGPDDHSKMVQCEQCDEWYHIRCIQMKEWWYDLVEHYFCPKCVTTERRCQYKKVCRLDGCNKAARSELLPDGSWKYCSDAHMDKWAERMIAKAPSGVGPSRGGAISRGELKRLVDQNPTTAQFYALGKKPHLKGVLVNDGPGDSCVEDYTAGSASADADLKEPIRKPFMKEGGAPTRGKWITLAELRKRVEANATTGIIQDSQATSSATSDEATQYIVSMETLSDGRLHDWLGQYLTEEEQMKIHSLNSHREELSKQRSIFEMKEKLTSFVKAKANRVLAEIKEFDNRKDICGYDRILGKNEPELDIWLKSEAGIEAFATGRLPDPAIDASVVEQDQIEGMCIRKRCTSHVQWFRLHMQDTRFEVAELTKQELKLDQLELAIFETVETRVLLVDA